MNGGVLSVLRMDEVLHPRCSGCAQPIVDGAYTSALGRCWHQQHFECGQCHKQIADENFVALEKEEDKENLQVSCLHCYDQHLSKRCTLCELPIGVEQRDVCYQDLHWHEHCFQCTKCQSSLLGKSFAIHKNCRERSELFCGNCYELEFASKCDNCGLAFKPGSRRMEHRSHKWHEHCFVCVVCKQPIGTRPFLIPTPALIQKAAAAANNNNNKNNNENNKDNSDKEKMLNKELDNTLGMIHCVPCFEARFATRCFKCDNVLSAGGVTFKNRAYHRQCFVCCNCNQMLAGQKFATREDKPYCAECFGQLFAKKCTSCQKPITGSGGTKFISFEGRHWHSNCFVCALCNVSMAGKGFITDGDDIVCPECAREKLVGEALQP